MFKTYIKTAFRNLVRNPLVSFINIFGLGLSMSVGLMILIRLQDDLGFDRFHPLLDLRLRKFDGCDACGDLEDMFRERGLEINP